MIPSEHNSSFVAHMERVLDVYKRPFDPLRPVVCMDESPKQLIAETRVPIRRVAGLPGRVARLRLDDFTNTGAAVYARCSSASEPLAGKRMVRITERRTKRDWVPIGRGFLEEIADQYESAEKIKRWSWTGIGPDHAGIRRTGHLPSQITRRKASPRVRRTSSFGLP